MHCGSQPPTKNKTANLIVQTIHAGEDANVFVKVEPRSACMLRSAGMDGVPVYGDVRGVATFFVSLDTVGATTDLSLECQATNGAGKSVYPIRVYSVADDEVTSAPTAWLDSIPFPGRPVAPLADPERATARQIAEQGLPLKPDRLKMPQAYASWLDHVSRPKIAVDPEPVDTGMVNDIQYPDQHVSWAGYVDTGYAGLTEANFSVVWGTWNVPKVDMTKAGTFNSSTWVGLGGYMSAAESAMPQTGTKQIATCGTLNSHRLTCVGSYYAWIEYYPLARTEPVADLPDPRRGHDFRGGRAGRCLRQPELGRTRCDVVLGQ